jgi:hypothetical protein
MPPPRAACYGPLFPAQEIYKSLIDNRSLLGLSTLNLLDLLSLLLLLDTPRQRQAAAHVVRCCLQSGSLELALAAELFAPKWTTLLHPMADCLMAFARELLTPLHIYDPSASKRESAKDKHRSDPARLPGLGTDFLFAPLEVGNNSNPANAGAGYRSSSNCNLASSAVGWNDLLNHPEINFSAPFPRLQWASFLLPRLFEGYPSCRLRNPDKWMSS